MTRILKVDREERCMGCGLCVFWASFGKESPGSFSLVQSPLQVERLVAPDQDCRFEIRIDEAFREILVAEKIDQECPRQCFVVTEEFSDGD